MKPPLTQAQQTLIADNWQPLRSRVGYFAKRLAGRYVGVEKCELHQDGWLGVIDASRRFDPAVGATFASFAERRIRGAMVDGMRQRDHLPRRSKLRGKVLTIPLPNNDYDDKDKRYSREPSPGSRIADLDEVRQRFAAAGTKRDQCLALTLIHAKGMQNKDVARVIGVTNGRVCQILAKARASLAAYATSGAA